MLGVVNELPIPSEVPPEAAAYQLRVPLVPVAPNTNEPVPHPLAGVVAVITTFSMVTVIKALALSHPAGEV